ncbi:MAG: PilZ domain-containing protein [Candidatus Acidiferrales bacterium]
MTKGTVQARNVPRAPRFALQIPVLFRRPGEAEWREGTTENVSRSGVLLRAEEAIPDRAPLEIRMALPAQIPGAQGASIICHAQVVRTVGPNGDSRPACAASICDYNLVPGFGG